MPTDRDSYAHLGGRVASGLKDVTTDPAALDSAGFWAVVVTFENEPLFARFADVRPAAEAAPHRQRRFPWTGPHPKAWRSSLDADAYQAGVRAVRSYIESGDVYQVNLCRVVAATLPEPGCADLTGLAARLEAGNPAPYSGVVDLPGHGVRVVSASPELFLRRDGDLVESRPIKGTGRHAGDLLPKDRAENVMIVDLVRNDLGRAAAAGSVHVPTLCALEAYPGLVHLVSTVRARVRPGAGWTELLAGTFPPGSVSGAPKASALKIIGELETCPRGPYCGAIGWVDADSRRGELAVGIRSFWLSGDELRFGTGAGITWDSDPSREWAETELKAARLLKLASGQTEPELA